jgi:hypothetical protein
MRPYGGGRSLSGYDTAQICINGHIITQFAQTRPGQAKKFCDKCGAATTSVCPKCSKPIQGYHHSPRVVRVVKEEPPAFCHECGEPYPWTEQRLAAVKQLTDEVAEFSAEEREQFQQSVNDIVKQTPNTPVAVNRLRRLMSKGGQWVTEGLRTILVDVLSEAIKKQIWG